MSSGLTFNVKENSTAKYSATIKDELDAVVPAADLTVVTLTLYNIADGAIINSRDAQNVLNANNVVITSGGVLTWTMQQGDNTIVDTTLEYEAHMALFEYTWDSGNKGSVHEVNLTVESLTNVP